jgi:uncharacterized membrane protein YphA (DoxX/SURF4 family)
MYQDHTPLQAAGQLLLAFAFLASGARNAFWKFRQHVERMGALGVPYPRWVMLAGLALNFAGGLLRHLHIGSLLVNAGVAGGLLLVAAI